MDRDRDEDEGIPSETEDDKRQLETKTKEMRGGNLLQRPLREVEAGAETDFEIYACAFLLLCLRLPSRSVEAEGRGDRVSAGGEGAALQGHVGGFESRRRGGLAPARLFLQVGLQSGSASGGFHHEGRVAGG